LTPSEIVLIHGSRFADVKQSIAAAAMFVLGGLTFLLDGRSRVSSQRLMTNMLKAALLAHEQAGSIRFEIGDGATPHLRTSRSLVVVPTGKKLDWPPATLESRLLLDRRATVADIVFDWLGEDSSNPWNRAAEQGKIMLVLRGVARVSSNWRGRSYRFADDGDALASQTSPQSAEALLARCRENRPEVWGASRHGDRKRGGAPSVETHW
jgi:hypothetical protein